MQKVKMVIQAQVWEWYGNEEMTEGRYKAKGGHDFVFEGDELELYDTQSILDKFNEKFNRRGKQWFCHEGLNVELYFEPTFLQRDDDGNFVESRA